MKVYPLIINGESIINDNTFDVINPATETVFAKCTVATPEQGNAAVEAAKLAFPSWSKTSHEERKSLIHQLAQLIDDNKDELMEIITLETGKPLQGYNNIGAGMEVMGAVGWAHVNADFDLPVEVVQDNDEARVEVHRKPLGVVASITPWNWPLLIAIWHIVPALRAGNTVVLKPSPFTPVATTRFVELANTVLPAGVLNIVSGGPELGAILTEHKDVAKVSFTGSTATGKTIMRSGSDTLKRMTLELGGNDAGIVLDDVDVQAIAPKLLGALFNNNGQTCAALKRLYVHENVYDEVCETLAGLANKLVVGDGLNADTDLGPLQNAKQFEIVKEFADSARKDNGQFLCGGNVIPGNGYFFEPTLVAGLSDGTKLVDEEPFGPIAPIIKFSDVDEVIARANKNKSGLGGSIWSADSAKAAKLAMQLECGFAWVNDHTSLQPDAPFGGVKESGIGVEHNTDGLKEFTSVQTVKILK